MARILPLAAIILLSQMLLVQLGQAREKAVSIGLIGDSTVASTYGWGPAFADRVAEHVTVLNYAKNGATLDSLSKKLDALLKAKPDYVIIQFGHNDMKRYNDNVYGDKLKLYVERIRKVGSKPIIFSSVTRRNFGENGKISPVVLNGRTLQAYALSAKAVAKDSQTPFLDLNTISIAHHNSIGPELSLAYNFKKTDRTHFSEAGAKQIADLIIKNLKAISPDLAAQLRQ